MHFGFLGACVLVLFVINYYFMHNSPKDAGLGDFETGDDAEDSDGKPSSVKYVLSRVFASRVMWMIALGSMMIGFVRRSVVDAWWPKYFVDFYGADKAHFATYLPYIIATWGIALFGIAGGFVFGIASDRTFGGRRAPVITFGFLGMAIILALFGLSDFLNFGPMIAACCLVLLSFCVNGAHGMISGAASMDFGGKKAVATAAGLFDGMQYLAGAFRRYGRRLHYYKLGLGSMALGANSLCTHWRLCDVSLVECDAERKISTLTVESGHRLDSVIIRSGDRMLRHSI